MTLSFPNPSRSLDETRNAVRFIGHDGMFEARFFVKAQALMIADAELGRSIYEVARKVYSSGRRDSYTLTAADFR
ncbi:DUF1488 family protein [Ensifer sp. MJa1]|uniref:DUF1488 family protein n=1 Tax=Ensifer sp. MJa1 TaxID=2919888 RepID=UPI0030096BB3